jgi:DNA polymerase elongation subunit (family B)
MSTAAPVMRYNLMTIDYLTKGDIPIAYLCAIDETGHRKFFVLKCIELEQRPRFYVRSDAVIPQTDRIMVVRPEPRRGLMDEVLNRIITLLPEDVGKLRELFSEHWEADNLFSDVVWRMTGIKVGFSIGAEGKPIPCDPLPLIPWFYIDIEVANPHEYFPDYKNPRWPIVLITTLDKLTGKVIAWVWREDFEPGILFSQVQDLKMPKYEFLRLYLQAKFSGINVELRMFNNETSMMNRFLDHLEVIEPTLITGYNISFDINYILARLRALTINPQRLSPLKVAFSRGEEEVEIYGIDVFDAARGFKDYYTSAYGELQSWKFALVVQKLLKKSKEEFWLGGSVLKAWKDDLNSLLFYGIGDAFDFNELMTKYEVFEYYNGIRLETGCRMSDTLSNFKVIDDSCLCDGQQVLPSGKYTKKKGESPGAIVFDPIVGIHENIAQVDAKSLYVNMILLNNISPDSEDPKGEHAIEIDLFGKKEVVRFRASPPGLCSRVLMRFEKRRDAIRAQMVGLDENSQQWKLLYQNQNAVKFLTSSLPGLLGNENFRLFNQRVHECVLASAKQTTVGFTKHTGKPPVYGDTDSSFLPVKDKVEAEELVVNINAWLLDKYKSDRIFVKLEHYWIRIMFLQKKDEPEGKKKHYCGFDDKGELKLVGIKRSDNSDTTLELFDSVYTALLKDNDVKKAMKAVQVERQKFRSRGIKEIAIPRGMSMDPEEYGKKDKEGNFILKNGKKTNVPLHVRGALYSRKWLKIPLGSGSKAMHVHVKNVKTDKMPQTDVVVFEHPSQVPWDLFEIDWDKMFNKTVTEKVRDIFASLGITLSEIYSEQRQTRMDRFVDSHRSSLP